MKLKKSLSLIGLTLVFSSPVFAVTMKTPVLTTTVAAPTAYEVDEFERTQWSMTTEEWKKYKLYSSENSLYSKYLDMSKTTPYRIMYEYGTTDEDKHKWLVKEAEFNAKMLKSDASYFDGLTIAAESVVAKLEKSPYAPAHFNSFGSVQLAPMSKDKTSRSLMFVDLNSCDDECSSFIKDSLSSSGAKHRLDIIIKGSGGDKNKLFAFAEEMGITKEQVNTRSITLNFDTGESKALGINDFPTTLHKNVLGAINVSYK
ncbi:hypothetical protein [Aliivibrio fischeri]|uniref:hypothetical protein n=1 Tax=Aliivibrio fischeri TaxID=668 RepID=UPI0007C442BC|nr:hypothetical protein [Aliivibrio fischeri]